MSQITFTPKQLTYLRDWFKQQSKQYVEAVMEDEFDADEDNFGNLCGRMFNVDGFKEGEISNIETTRRDSNGEKKKKRKPKDPNAPKRPKSAYMCWLWSDEGVKKVKEENRKEIDGKIVDIEHKKAVGEASKIWNNQMTEQDKIPWVEESNQSKQNYEKLMKDYTPNKTTEIETEEELIECPDGYEIKKGMYLTGYAKIKDGKSDKTKYDSLQEAIDNTIEKQHEDIGGIVFDGTSYTIRKSGNPRESTKNETLFLKK
tara:strand:+ start:1115 stop:1888 length:774 start_codon:yes stop_codon:yes gene_type:complete